MASVEFKDIYSRFYLRVKDYETDFIEGCLIEAWDKVKGLCQEVFYDLPF